MAKKENWRTSGILGIFEYLINYREVCDTKENIYFLSV